MSAKLAPHQANRREDIANFTNSSDKTEVVDVTLGDFVEQVEIDPKLGPLLFNHDGSRTTVNSSSEARSVRSWRTSPGGFTKKAWPEYSKTEKMMIIIMVAKKNLKLREYKDIQGNGNGILHAPESQPLRGPLGTRSDGTLWD
eukprot:gnl/TRDRNA2_/TRDRNA2_86389_c0_seq1.p1 gnl/TRDRNA2_/TRDRNA2_86389_c0~~gnl/TRDRNA2_/TRDRNA2_86389_c0_seq1.p1  ORF type:complete len:143 (+),score=21.06 gnl/TRDRNA2_/TRDRNA2_86389_c0_seq1:93-521(+)